MDVLGYDVKVIGHHLQEPDEALKHGGGYPAVRTTPDLHPVERLARRTNGDGRPSKEEVIKQTRHEMHIDILGCAVKARFANGQATVWHAVTQARKVVWGVVLRCGTPADARAHPPRAHVHVAGVYFKGGIFHPSRRQALRRCTAWASSRWRKHRPRMLSYRYPTALAPLTAAGCCGETSTLVLGHRILGGRARICRLRLRQGYLGVVWCGVVWCCGVWRGMVCSGMLWCGVPKALLPKGKGRDVNPRAQVHGRAVCVVRTLCANVFRKGRRAGRGRLGGSPHAIVVSPGAPAGPLPLRVLVQA